MKPLLPTVLLLIASSSLAGQDWKNDSAALSDYTADAKATKALIAGDFTRGIYVSLEEHSAVTMFTDPALARLDTKIEWRVTAKSLKHFGPGGFAFYDAPTTKRRWNAVAVFQDLDKPNAKAVEKVVGEKFAAGLALFYLVCTDPSQATEAEVRECSSRHQFEQGWRKATAGSDYRFMLMGNMAWITKVPANAKASRRNLVQEYLAASESLVTQLSEKPQSSGLAAAMYKKTTNQLFEQLNGTGVIDDKFKSYELYWYAKLDQLGVDGQDVGIDLKQFRANLLAAAQNTKCTVKVFTTNGQNADIRVAKRDGLFKSLGPSVVTTDLERASYYFQAWRDGKLTGETSSPVDCTGKFTNVTITEE